MGNPMRIRAVETDGVVDVKVLMNHVMESGQRKDASGAVVPAHHIQHVVATLNGAVVVEAEWGPAISKDPFWNFRFRGGRKGDRLAIRWTDNRGDSRTDETVVG